LAGWALLPCLNPQTACMGGRRGGMGVLPPRRTAAGAGAVRKRMRHHNAGNAPRLAAARVPWPQRSLGCKVGLQTHCVLALASCVRRGVVTRGRRRPQVGCETEFYLLKEDPASLAREAGQTGVGPLLVPLDDSKYCQSSSITAAAEGVWNTLNRRHCCCCS